MGESNTRCFAGLDIGGTSVKSILVDAAGNLLGDMVEVPSRVKDGYEATFAQLEEALLLLTDSARAGVPVYMTNDGNAAAAGEYAARPDSDAGLLLVAPGTGLGGGLVLPGGQIYEGSNGLALEVGHASVPFREANGELPACSCGLTGCAEAWVSLMALRRRLEIELARDKWKGHALNASDASIEEKAYQLRDYAENGDPLAVSLFKEQAFILGYAIANWVRLFDPGLVVIGGGLSEASFRDRYMAWVIEGFKDGSWPIYLENPFDTQAVSTQFEWARGGDSAAALGMAFVASGPRFLFF